VVRQGQQDRCAAAGPPRLPFVDALLVVVDERRSAQARVRCEHDATGGSDRISLVEVGDFVDARVVQVRGVEVPIWANRDVGNADRHAAFERLDEEVPRGRWVFASVQRVEVEAVPGEVRPLDRIDRGDMAPARSLESGVVGPMTGTPYVEPAGSVGSVVLYEFTMKRSDAGASNVFGYGEMNGAKIAMMAKTRTTAAPAIPRRL